MSDSENQAQQQSWLATICFAFISLYMQLRLSIDLLSLMSIGYILGGLVICRLLIDLPGQYLQRYIYVRSQQNTENQGEDKAAAINTFVKAAQVILAFVLAHLTHPLFF